MALSRFVLTANVTIPWPGVWSEVVNQAPIEPVTQPAVPASTVGQDNNNPFPVVVTVTGGTVTVIAVNGVTTGITSGAVYVPAGQSIAITYSVAPTWSWLPVQNQSGGAGVTALVGSPAPAGGQFGSLPSITFLAGTAIYADSAAIAAGTPGTGAQQLYQAIGSGNLRAFMDGTDNVGHAALSN